MGWEGCRPDSGLTACVPAERIPCRGASLRGCELGGFSRVEGTARAPPLVSRPHGEQPMGSGRHRATPPAARDGVQAPESAVSSCCFLPPPSFSLVPPPPPPSLLPFSSSFLFLPPG